MTSVGENEEKANTIHPPSCVFLTFSKQLEDTIAKAENLEGESIKLLGEKTIKESEKPLDKTKVPFPLRLAKLNLEAQFNKFVDMFKKICINIPFAEALSQIPLYAKFLKENFSKKRKIEHNETIALTRESSAIRVDKVRCTKCTTTNSTTTISATLSLHQDKNNSNIAVDIVYFLMEWI